VPTKQALDRQRLHLALRGVQHHFDDALDVAIGFDQTANSWIYAIITAPPAAIIGAIHRKNHGE
jgi:hypothetical protein